MDIYGGILRTGDRNCITNPVNIDDVHRLTSPDNVFHVFSTNRGMNRSIIPGKLSPLSNFDVTIAAHARLDNRPQLCSSLHLELSERSDLPDHELMLLAYMKWGIECVHRFRGDWSFAIWDGRTRELHLATDYISGYALYYKQSDSQFIFSNSLRTLIEIDPDPVILNELYLLQRFIMTRTVNPVTVIKDVRKVPPGTVISIRPGNEPIPKRYWFPTHLNRIDVRNETELIEEFHFLYRQAVQRRIQPNQRIATHLSGGLDSGSVSWVTADLLNDQGQRLQAFTGTEFFDTSTYNHGRGNEEVYARITAKAAGNIDQMSFSCPEASMLDSIINTVHMLGQVSHGVGNIYWVHAISEYAKAQHINALLVGQVGNASITWAGISVKKQIKWLLKDAMDSYQILRYKNHQVGNSPVHPKSFFYPEIHSFFNKDWLNQFTINDYLASEYDPLDDTIPSWVSPKRISLLNFRAANIGSFWETMSQYYGIYHWDPTADQELVEFCLRLPESYYARNGGRNLVRKAFAGKIPDEILYKKLKGQQSSDWLQRFVLERHRWMELFAELPNNHPMSHILNVPALIEAVKNIDPDSNSIKGRNSNLISGSLGRMAGAISLIR